jgi:exopolysaccharide biosynthesis polyprenyl glycosylphosphotransferase
VALSLVYYYEILLRVAIYFTPVISFLIAGYWRFGTNLLPSRTAVVLDNYLILLLVTEFVWVIAANYYKLSTVTNLFWEHTGIRAAIYACCATFLSQNVLLVFAKQLVISRLFVLVSTAFLFVTTVALRMLFRTGLSKGRLPRKSERILMIGSDQYARRAVSLLNRVPFLRCKIQGYIQLPGQAIRVNDAPVMTKVDPGMLENLEFDEVVVAIPAERYMQASSFVDSLQNLGKPIRAILDLGPRLSIQERLFQVGRLQVMSLAIFPIESFAYTVLKRAFDLVFSALALIILSPVLLATAILVKISSPGPIVFRQERIGRHGQIFTLLKFRTMQCGTREQADTVWTTKDDPRCTRIGSFLRKFSLDELPQLWNVLRGEMSLVGPRPERPHFVAKFRNNILKYNTRHCCKVGITGWAQVNGLRGDTSISDRLRYDLYYVRNWSLALDLRIILLTFLTVLRDQNGY